MASRQKNPSTDPIDVVATDALGIFKSVLPLTRLLLPTLDAVEVTLTLRRRAAGILAEAVSKQLGIKPSRWKTKRNRTNPNVGVLSAKIGRPGLGIASLHVIAYTKSDLATAMGHHVKLTFNGKRYFRQILAGEGMCDPLPTDPRLRVRANYLPVSRNLQLDTDFREREFSEQLDGLIELIRISAAMYERTVKAAAKRVTNAEDREYLARPGVLDVRVRLAGVETPLDLPKDRKTSLKQLLAAGRRYYPDLAPYDGRIDGVRGKMAAVKNNDRRLRIYCKADDQARFEPKWRRNGLVATDLSRLHLDYLHPVWRKWLRGVHRHSAGLQARTRLLGRNLRRDLLRVLLPLRLETALAVARILASHADGPVPVERISPDRLLRGRTPATYRRVRALLRRMSRRAIRSAELDGVEYNLARDLRDAGFVCNPGRGLWSLNEAALRRLLRDDDSDARQSRPRYPL